MNLEQFHGKSARSLVKILRCAQDDSVGAWIGVILMGAAVRLHARSARRWALWGRARKGWFSDTGAGFLWGRARKGWFSDTSVDSILPWHPKSIQSEEGYLQRCGRIQFNFVAPQQ